MAKNFQKLRIKIALLKYAFLSAGFCLILGIIISLYMGDISNTENNLEDPTKNTKPILTKNYNLNIIKSAFEGLSNDKTPYKIFAHNVAKDLQNIYFLKSVNGYYNQDKGSFLVSASKGYIDEEKKSILLKEDVEVNFNGIIFRGSEIKINLDTKNASSNESVEVNFNRSTIKANNFKTENSDVIMFNGNVESIMNIDQLKK